MKTMMILAAVLLLAGCITAEPPKADDIAVTLAPNERKVIRVEENITTGFSWVAECDDPALTVEIEHRSGRSAEEDDSSLCGAPGEAVVSISAKESFRGPAAVVLKYQRPWSKSTAKVMELTVRAK